MSATNRGAKRREADFYPTPPQAVFALANELCLTADRFTWGEPCAGDGAIISAMWRAHGIEPRRWEWAELREGRDYLQQGLTGPVDGVITNPPFSLAQEFIERSLSEVRFSAYLLRMNFMGSQKRCAWWCGREPTHLFTLADRPSFTGTGSDATEYAWFVWDYLKLCKRGPGMYSVRSPAYPLGQRAALEGLAA